ncbi:MAG TPA: hypothetical protein PK253_16990 [Spirochaetota bacterium]|nr:hypothetical protein [Spirochaetota bacterium]
MRHNHIRDTFNAYTMWRSMAMKIQRFNDLTSHRRSGNAGTFFRVNGRQHTYLTRSSDWGDIVEISEEAKQRLEAEIITDREAERKKRDSRKYLLIIREHLDLDEGDQRSTFRPWKAAETLRALHDEKINIESDITLRGTAEQLLYQIAA